MWVWLNQNAGSVQAFTSVVTVVLTGVLVVVTWQYVKLTRTLAEVALAQLKGQEEASAVESRELNNLISRLWMTIGDLPRAPHEQDVDRRMRSTASWDDFPFDRFNSLAAALSFQAGTHAAAVTLKMKWLADRRKEVRSVPTQVGYNWTAFPWEKWNENIAAIYQDLAALNMLRAAPENIEYFSTPPGN